MKLSDYGLNRYSQFGEDGVIAEIFKRVGEGHRVCVEFGAGNGISCSNTASLRNSGWKAVLVEADPKLAEQCKKYESDNVTVINQTISPIGQNSIDQILDGLDIVDVDFMSIDVDGDDYWIFGSLVRRPRVVCVEFNKTVPPHLDIIPRGPGNRFGVGPLTMKKAAELRGYTFVGITGTNLFFVITEYADEFEDLDTELTSLLPPENFMYLATDYDGHVIPVGHVPSWGLLWPPSPTRMVPNQDDLLTIESEQPAEKFAQQVLAEFRDLYNRLVDNGYPFG